MLKVWRKIFEMLSPADRRRFWLLALLTLMMGLLDAAGVVAILPFLAVASDPAVIDSNPLLSSAYAASGAASHLDFTVMLGWAVLGVMTLGIGMRIVAAFALTRFIRDQVRNFGVRLFARYLDRPYAWFLTRHTADMGNSVIVVVAHTVNGPLTHAMHIMSSAVVAVAIALAVIAIDPVVALTGVAVLGGTYGAIILLVRRWLDRLGVESLAMSRRRFKVAQEALGGVKDVKLLNLEERYVARFRTAAARLAEIQTISAVVGQLPRHVLEALCFGGIMAYVLYLLSADGGGLTAAIPILGVYAVAGVRLFPVLQRLYASVVALRIGGAALDSLHEDLTADPPAPVAPAGPAPIRVERDIRLDRVSFAFEGSNRPALDGIELRIPARSRVGVVGATGAGKTTAIDVLLGLLEPQSGALLVDGVAIGPHNVRSWRRSMGYVPQSIYLTDDTVAGNIAFGLEAGEIDRAAVERAARTANLHDFVMTLPKGYDTVVGERGARLSGGQRQRVGIARALYADPDVLVFDEATSALDNITEKAVMEAVEALEGEKTVVMIAHRLTTVRRCDTIFFLEHGRVSAQGDYDTLMRTCPAFRRMHDAAAA